MICDKIQNICLHLNQPADRLCVYAWRGNNRLAAGLSILNNLYGRGS